MAKKALFVLGMLLLALSVAGFVLSLAPPSKAYNRASEPIGGEQYAPPTMLATSTQTAAPSPTLFPTMTPTATPTLPTDTPVSANTPKPTPTKVVLTSTPKPTLTKVMPPQRTETAPLLNDSIAKARVAVESIGGTMDRIYGGGALDCSLFMASYQTILESPTYDVSAQSPYVQNAYAQYHGVVESIASSKVSKIAEICQQGGVFGQLDVGKLDFYEARQAIYMAGGMLANAQIWNRIALTLSPTEPSIPTPLPTKTPIPPTHTPLPTNTPVPPTPTIALSFTPPPTDTPVPTDTTLPNTTTPGVSPTPLPTLIIEAEWPNELQTDVSDFVRIRLISNAPAGFEVTIERPGHTGVASTAIPQGTQESPLPQAFGLPYQACAVPSLNSTTISVKPDTVDCRSLEEGPWNWEWNISSDKVGSQLLNMNMIVKWTPQNGGDPIKRQIWQQRVYINVKQPVIVMGQLNVLSLVGVLISAGLSVPYLSEWWKARKSRPRGKRKNKR